MNNTSKNIWMILMCAIAGNAFAACIPTTWNGQATPIMAGANNLTIGNNGTISAGGAAAPITVTAGTNAVPNPGAAVTANPTLPPVAAFPANPNPNGTTNVNANTTIQPGNYGTINTAAGTTTTFAAGTYNITNLNANGNIVLSAGTYYINNFNLKGNLTVTGAVQLIIGNQIDFKANNIGMNAGGNPANLMVTLTSGAQFDAGVNGASFTGVIYGPAANTQVQFNNNATITGAIITGGQVQIGNNVTINNPPAVQTQVNSVTCPGGGFDHIQIDHAGAGLTCSPQAVTVKACADAACTTLYTGGTVTGNLAPGGLAFSITNGSVVAYAQQSTTGTATLGATAIAPTPTAATQVTCLNTATNAASCAMTFSAAGFLVTAPNHAACTNAAVTVEAVQTNPTTNRCVPAYANVTRAVNLSMAYTNPTTGTKTLTDVTNNSAITTAASAHNLTFDATGKATLTVSYPDVGQVTLTASDTAPTGAAMTGSAAFIAAPATFAITGVTAGPIKAGNNFAATITAKTAVGAACATAATAPNFGKETPPEAATLTFSKCQPTGAGAANGLFTGTATFANGVANATNLNWSEVGNGDLVATLTSGSYLGSALTATGNTGTGGTACTGAGNVGAFIPDHFDTAVVNGCLTCGFTYSGQPFTLTITAKNGLAVPTTTVNYDGSANTTPNFANNVSVVDANAAATTVGKFSVPAAALGVTANVAGTTLTVPKADFTAGVAALNSVPIYTFNTVTTAPTVLKLRATDSVNAAATSSGFTEGLADIRSGRIVITNAYGSELAQLSMNATVQYYLNVATGWTTSATDNSTSFNTALSGAGGNVVATIAKGPLALANVSVVGAAIASVTNGVRTFKLAAPGVIGSVSLSLNAPSYLPTTAGMATFGVYKGGTEMIYLREGY